MKNKATALCGLMSGLLLAVSNNESAATTITHGGDSLTMDFVDIGNIGNTADTATDFGAVSYNYSIGTYEVTSQQWAAVSSFDANIETGSNADPYSGTQPTAYVSWYEAVKFANWMTSGNALQGAYQFTDSTTYTGVDRDAAVATYGTIYVLPTEDEWYKAAYLKSDGSAYTYYSVGEDSDYLIDGIDFAGDTDYDSVFNDGHDGQNPLAVGGGTIENNGTYDMGGNVMELTESAFDGSDDPDEWITLRGGHSRNSAFHTGSSYYRSRFDIPQDYEGEVYGFRLASISGAVVTVAVPEPSSVGLLAIGALGVMLRRKRG